MSVKFSFPLVVIVIVQVKVEKFGHILCGKIIYIYIKQEMLSNSFRLPLGKDRGEDERSMCILTIFKLRLGDRFGGISCSIKSK